MERQQTEQEMAQERKKQFMDLCKEVYADGILEDWEAAKLESRRIELGIDRNLIGINHDFGAETAKEGLSILDEGSCSPELKPLFLALCLAIDPNRAKRLGANRDKCQFYLDYIVSLEDSKVRVERLAKEKAEAERKKKDQEKAERERMEAERKKKEELETQTRSTRRVLQAALIAYSAVAAGPPA